AQPQEGGRRDAVHQEHRLALALVDVGELPAGDRGPVHPVPRRMASTTRTTRTISFTSWTRTACTPCPASHATAPAVPSSRSSTPRSPSTFPTNDFRDGPTSTG